jgi:hypothetical protein
MVGGSGVVGGIGCGSEAVGGMAPLLRQLAFMTISSLDNSL